MKKINESFLDEDRALVALARDKESIPPNLKAGMMVYLFDKHALYYVVSKGVYHRLFSLNPESIFNESFTIEGDLTVINGKINYIDTNGNTTELSRKSSYILCHVEEFVTEENQTLFELKKGRYMPGYNLLNLYVNGALQSQNSYEEINDTTIKLKTALPPEQKIIIQYITETTELFYRDEFYLSATDTVLNLKHEYIVGSNKLKVFLDGALISKDAYEETDRQTITFKAPPGECVAIVEYFIPPIE